MKAVSSAAIVPESLMASIKLSRYEAEEGDLPEVCMCCGAEATERKRRRFVSHPLWVYLLVGFGFVPYVVAAAILTEHIRCYTLFCPRHKNYWFLRSLLIWGALPLILILIIGSLFLMAVFSDRISKSVEPYLAGAWCFGTVVLLFCWFISIPISQVTAIHPTDATDTRLILKCVSPEFVEAVRRHRAERKKATSAQDYGEHFGPRRSSLQSREEEDEDMQRS